MRNYFTKGAAHRIAVLAVLGVASVWMAYDVVESVRFFSQDLRRLWQLVLVVLVGTPALVCFRMLSESCRRRIGSWVLGLAAGAVTAFAFYFLGAWWKLRDVFPDGADAWLMALNIMMVWGFAVWFWWLVWQRSRTMRPPHGRRA